MAYDKPDVRLRLARPNGGETLIQIATVQGQTAVQMVRTVAGNPAACVSVKPEELDAVIDAYTRCRCVLLGAPRPGELMERLGATATKGRRKRR
jgi:hypothetical protein